MPEIETEDVPERRSKRLNPDAIVIEQKAMTPNSYRIPFDVPTFILQQDEEVDSIAPNIYQGPTEGAPNFILQEVNSASNVESTIPPVTVEERISFSVPTMFSKDAVNLVMSGIYYGEREDKWTPRTFITASTGISDGEDNYD